MTTTTSFYRQEPHFQIRGGADYDFTLTFDIVRSSTLDGTTTEIVRLGLVDFTGWSNFRGALMSSDERYTEPCSVLVEGDAENGTLRLRGRGVQTWRLQGAGVRAGSLTIIGRNPFLQEVEVETVRWSLVPGSTSPLVVPVFDWTQLR